VAKDSGKKEKDGGKGEEGEGEGEQEQEQEQEMAAAEPDTEVQAATRGEVRWDWGREGGGVRGCLEWELELGLWN
jgi:hypothetical protein